MERINKILKDLYIKDVLFSLVTFFLLIISVNILLFPETPGFLGMNPHPYLIAILLMSGRFSLKEGLLSACLASLIMAFYIFLQNHSYFSFSLFTQQSFLISVASFFLAAIVVGEMRSFNKSYERSLLRENSELKGERTRLKEQLEIVTQLKEELENRIIGQEETIHSIYRATKGLETLDEKEFYKSLTQIAARFTGATIVTLFIIDYANEQVVKTAEYGMDGAPLKKTRYPLYKDIFGLVIKNNFILTIKEISDREEHLSIWEKSEHKAYAYIPISLGSIMVGILTIDEIPFLKLNISTVRILSLISELAVPALKNIIKYQDLQEMVKIDPVTELLKFESFYQMAEVEFKKATRYHLDFSVILVEATGLKNIEEEIGHENRVKVTKWISNKLQEILRNVDILGLGQKDDQFVMALPMTNLEGVLVVTERIKEILSTEDNEPELSQLFIYIGAASYHPSVDSFRGMMKIAYNSLELNKRSKTEGKPVVKR